MSRNEDFIKNYKAKSKTNAGEIKVYGLHLIPENDIKRLMTEEVKNIIKKYSLGITPCEWNYGILLFDNVDDRNTCAKELEKFGIKVAYEVCVGYIDARYAKKKPAGEKKNGEEDNK